jgi:hypothetical protein
MSFGEIEKQLKMERNQSENKFKISYGAKIATHGPNQQLDHHFITSAKPHTCSNPRV